MIAFRLNWRVLPIGILLAGSLLILISAGCSRKGEKDSGTSEQSQKQPEEAPEGMTDAELSLLGETSATGYKSSKFPMAIYKDAGIAGGYFPDGWMGDFKDVTLNVYCEDRPHSGKTCIKIDYKAGASQNSKWAGVYWLFPGSQWGKKKGGLDLTGAKKLTFWARGEKGGETIQEVKMGGISGEYKDSDTAGIGPIVLSKDWQEFEIDLDGVDLSYVSGGFCWATNLNLNPEGCTFYLDDIIYE